MGIDTMTPRQAIQEALLYMTHPNRIVETYDIRAGLRKALSELPMSDEEKAAHEKMCGSYQARKQIHVKPNHVLDNA